jgi:cytochrome c
MAAIRQAVTTGLASVSALLVLGLTAYPDEPDVGKAQFLANCAVCHGTDARGDGPLGATLKTKPTDLTLLAKHSYGGFSPDAVYKLVEGREPARAHLSVEMPVWGCRYESSKVPRRKVQKRSYGLAPKPRRQPPETTLESLLNLPCDPEWVIKDRIESIIDYLSRIQEK